MNAVIMLDLQSLFHRRGARFFVVYVRKGLDVSEVVVAEWCQFSTSILTRLDQRSGRNAILPH